MTRLNYLLVSILSIALMGCGRTTDVADIALPAADPAGGNGRGLSGFHLALVSPYLGWQALLDTRAGFAVLAARDGQLQYAASAGHADIGRNIPFAIDTPVRIASMTKPVTAVAALQLVEQGRLGLDDAVADYIPGLAARRVASSPHRNADGDFDTVPLQRPLTVRDLLEFRTGMGDLPADNPPGTPATQLDQAWDHWFSESATLSLKQRVESMGALPLQEQPGERWRYGYDLEVVAHIVEIISGQPFDDYLAAHIFQPLGMDATRFMPAPDDRTEIATVYGYGAGDELIPAVDRPWDSRGRVMGSSGLVSTAPDYLRFALMLWNRGSYNDVEILKPETVALMSRLHVPSGVLRSYGMEGLGWGLGIGVVADDSITPFPATTGDFYWSGYYGTHFWISPESGLVFVYVTQQDPALGNGINRGQSIPYVVQALLMRSLD